MSPPTEARESRVDLLALMAHDLVQPLTSLRLRAQMLAARVRDGTADQQTLLSGLAFIEQQSTALAQRIGGFLESGRAGEIELSPRVERCDVLTLLQDVLRRFDERERRRVQVAASGILGIVECDGQLVARVIQNIVDNALKYSPSDRGVRLTARGSGGEKEVSVEDEGMGIRAEELPRLFERYYRSPRTSDVASGSGLGLYACSRIVAAHGGSLWATSSGEGQGATFHVRLPRRVAA